MHRRQFLTTLSGVTTVGLAGCSSAVDSVLPRSTPYPEGRQRRITLDSQDMAPEEHAVSIDVELLEPTVTDDHPARLRLTTTNEGPRRALSIHQHGCSLFNRDSGLSDDPPGLVLIHPGRIPYIERPENAWVRDLPPDEHVARQSYGCAQANYDAGGSRSNEYTVWDDYRTEGYFEPGTYRWEEDVTITEPRPADRPLAELGTFSWGFALTVADA